MNFNVQTFKAGDWRLHNNQTIRGHEDDVGLDKERPHIIALTPAAQKYIDADEGKTLYWEFIVGQVKIKNKWVKAIRLTRNCGNPAQQAYLKI